MPSRAGSRQRERVRQPGHVVGEHLAGRAALPHEMSGEGLDEEHPQLAQAVGTMRSTRNSASASSRVTKPPSSTPCWRSVTSCTVMDCFPTIRRMMFWMRLVFIL